MNYMPEVAKMLGVELGERFKINFRNDPTNISGRNISDNEYFFSDRGVEVITAGYSCISADVLFKLIGGEWEVYRKPWKPNLDDQYYYVDEIGYACSDPWINSALDMVLYKIGNCYRTKEEAEANRDKWISFYKSDEVLEV